MKLAVLLALLSSLLFSSVEYAVADAKSKYEAQEKLEKVIARKCYKGTLSRTDEMHCRKGDYSWECREVIQCKGQ